MHQGWESAGIGLHVLGVSTRTAPLTLRERLALDEDAVEHAQRTASAMLGPVGLIVLSTCNRTELVLDGATSAGAIDAWHRTVVAGRVDRACPALAAARYHHTAGRAAEHLFRVACGLESAVLGDAEIVGQLRRAVARSRDAGMLGPRLSRLADHAFRAAKRARATTAISAGGAGVGSAAASVVASGARPGARVLLLGAGDAAAVIARELTKRLPVALEVANRTAARAEELAARVGGSVVQASELEAALLRADVIIAATSSPIPVLPADLIGSLRRREQAWSPLVIDAGMPRNVEPVAGVDLVALDSLAEREARMHRLRAAAVPEVERQINDGLTAWAEADQIRFPAQRHPLPAA